MLQQSGRPVLKLASVAMAIAAIFVLSACASNASYQNNPKPPATLTVSVIIGEDQISASPIPFGAGPTRFVMTNQTGTKQTVTLSTDTFDRKVAIDVNQTTNFKQTLQPGNLSIDSSNTAANSLDITVGPTRKSAQQDLGQP
jgi:hypothetical protein